VAGLSRTATQTGSSPSTTRTPVNGRRAPRGEPRVRPPGVNAGPKTGCAGKEPKGPCRKILPPPPPASPKRPPLPFSNLPKTRGTQPSPSPGIRSATRHPLRSRVGQSKGVERSQGRRSKGEGSRFSFQTDSRPLHNRLFTVLLTLRREGEQRLGEPLLCPGRGGMGSAAWTSRRSVRSTLSVSSRLAVRRPIG
jgi:hypothetical protein